MKPEIVTTYKAEGFVLGNYWGGGRGSYKAVTIEHYDLDHLNKVINEKLLDGSLDSGMGYESLIGAIYDITVIRKIEVDGLIYTNHQSIVKFFGKLTGKQRDFLTDVFNENVK